MSTLSHNVAKRLMAGLLLQEYQKSSENSTKTQGSMLAGISFSIILPILHTCLIVKSYILPADCCFNHTAWW